MLYYNTLEHITIEELHKAFIEAFSDYQVRIDLPLWKFTQMLQRRGYCSELSIGAFDENRLIGFVLNGFRDWHGRKTVYDLGTGVIPDYRRQGITSAILKQIRKLLQEQKLEQYLLEVITTNTSAVQLYQKQGFELQREFTCYDMDKKDFSPHSVCAVEQVNSIATEQLMDFWDFTPSWQNSSASIHALQEAFAYSVARIDNVIVGFGIIDRRTGDIPQIAVNKSHRRNGIGSSILADLVQQTAADKIGILNIDIGCESLNNFLKKSGFHYRIGQYEMLLPL